MREGSPPLCEAIDSFADDLILRGSPASARSYRSLLRHLRPYDVLTPALCRQVLHQVLSTRSVATANTTWCAMSALSNWLVDQGYYTRSPMTGIPIPRKPPGVHRYPSHDELGRVYAACKDDRERLIIRLLLHGLRAGQLLALRWDDVSGDVLLIRPHKRNPAHPVVLDAETVSMLLDSPRPDARVFPRSYEALRALIARIGKRAGVPGFHAHALRHAFASNWMLEGGDAATLQQLGGWKDQRMITEVYARSAMQEAAIRRSRAIGLVGKLLKAPE